MGVGIELRFQLPVRLGSATRLSNVLLILLLLKVPTTGQSALKKKCDKRSRAEDRYLILLNNQKAYIIFHILI